MAQALQQALVAHERIRKSTDLPLFYGQKDKDTVRPHDFIDRFEAASRIANWVPAPAQGQAPNYARKCQEFYMLLRGKALDWYTSLGDLSAFNYEDWDALKREFLKSHAPRYTARTACLSFTDLAQRSGEEVHDFYLRVAKAFHLLKEVRPAAILEVQGPALNVDIDDLAARQAAVNDYARQQLQAGVDNMSWYFVQQLFTAGLLEEIRIKVMDGPLNNIQEAYERALHVESVLRDKRDRKSVV